MYLYYIPMNVMKSFPIFSGPHLMSMQTHAVPDISGLAAGAADGRDRQRLGHGLGDLRAGAADCRVHHQMGRLAGVQARLHLTAN